MDLFNNPMVSSAKKALTAEQQEEYKKVGEYMYKNLNYNEIEASSMINKKPSNEDLAFYAMEAIKAGGHPRDLSEAELNALTQVFGVKWYEKFDYTEKDIPKGVFDFFEKPKMNKPRKNRKQK